MPNFLEQLRKTPFGMHQKKEENLFELTKTELATPKFVKSTVEDCFDNDDNFTRIDTNYSKDIENNDTK